MPELIFVRDALTPAERGAYYRQRRTGELVVVAAGVCVARHEWERLDPDARYRVKIRAALSRTKAPVVASHSAAAVLWRLPWLGRWPDMVHATVVGAEPVRATANCRMHERNLTTWREVDGLPVTSLERTVVDVAATNTLSQAVVLCDAALARRVNASELQREASLVPLRRGSRKVAMALQLADGLSGSPGESLSRLTLLRAGFPTPILQHRFALPDGPEAIVDFWWPEYRVVGEFDGHGKYLRPEWTAGREPADIVIAEKWREDGLRALGLRVVRWGWSEASSTAELAKKLSWAGLPARSSSAGANFRAF